MTPHTEPPVDDAEQPPPRIRDLVFGNALALSGVYLALGLGMELVRRFAPRPVFEASVRRMDDLPGTVLHWLGLLPMLRRMIVYEGIGTWTIRVAFGLTTMAIIFALAAFTGLLLALLRWILRSWRD
jgi:hypothetical protein